MRADAVHRARELQGLREELLLRERAMASASEGITISDMRHPDSPLIYANAGFERLTGFSRGEVLNRNCRFLQGDETDTQTVLAIRSAIAEGRTYAGELLNYRKDGTPFWNRLSLTPLRDEQGKVTHYVGVQTDITARVTAESELRNALELLQKTNAQLSAANEKMRRNLQAAAAIQQALLPNHTPTSDRVRFAWRFQPSDELAGDILNIFRLDKTHIGMYLLDVTGHGTAAALLAVSVSRFLEPNARESSILWTPVQSATRKYAISRPAEVAERLNQRFPWDNATGQLFTLIYGVLNLKTMAFSYVCAGHPSPMLLANGNEVQLPRSQGLPIGVSMEDYEEFTVTLAPGARLLFFSDGVTEAMNAQNEPYGRDRVRQKLANPERSIDAVLTDVLGEVGQWQQKSSHRDDLSLLAVEILPPAAPAESRPQNIP